CGTRGIARLERGASRGRGRGLVVDFLACENPLNDLDLKAKPSACVLEKLGRAGPASAKEKIISRDGGADSETADEDFGNKFFRGTARQGAVEGDNDHAIEAQPFQRYCLAVSRCQAKNRIRPPKKIGRVWLEGQDGARSIESLGHATRMRDHHA